MQWKKELANYNLDKSIIAEILSKNPDGEPLVEKYNTDDHGIFHAIIHGLDRKHSLKIIVETLYPSFKNFCQLLT